MRTISNWQSVLRGKTLADVCAFILADIPLYQDHPTASVDGLQSAITAYLMNLAEEREENHRGFELRPPL